MVDIDVKSTTTQTTVSCSDYLSAQSQSLDPRRIEDPKYYAPFKRSFLSSPECTSYAKWIDAKQGRPQVLSFSNCASSLTKPLEDYLPFRYLGASYPGQYCCGPCAVLIDEIRVLYFADQSPVLCSNKSLQTSKMKSYLTSTITSSLQINRNRADSLHTDEYSIAILDGHTL